MLLRPWAAARRTRPGTRRPVEQTFLDVESRDSVTAVTRLPPPVDEVEATVEQRP